MAHTSLDSISTLTYIQIDMTVKYLPMHIYRPGARFGDNDLDIRLANPAHMRAVLEEGRPGRRFHGMRGEVASAGHRGPPEVFLTPFRPKFHFWDLATM